MLASKNNEQLQIRIDAETKKQAKKVLDSLGMDMSSAIKIFLRQVINTRNFPCELRDVNGFTLRKAEVMREALTEARSSGKTFRKGSELIKAALKD